MSEIKAKSSSVSSATSASSSCRLSEMKITANEDRNHKETSTASIPIATIAKNRKLTLGEIQEVHDCALIDGKLAFIVTLRGCDSVKGKIKVFKHDINTNSLRHAVPFAALCAKNECENVKELENKLISNKDRNESITKHTVTVEISCDATTSLQQLASIASVVNNNECSGSESTHSTPSLSSTNNDPKSGNTNKYNLRSKKRKFRELNEDEEDNKQDAHMVDLTHVNTNNAINPNMPKLQRPSLLSVIPNTISIGPTISPTKMLGKSIQSLRMENNQNNNGRNTVSAPNTPLLNGQRKQIINLINSPSSTVPKPLQFPQISLPQGNFTLLGPLKVMNKASIHPPNMNMNNLNHAQKLNGISNLDPKALQQLQQLIMIQKQLSLKQQQQQKSDGVITQITNLNPIRALPPLETEDNNTNSASYEPPQKRAKLCASAAAAAVTEPFWSERLRLDGILNTHKACLQRMSRLDTMRSWTHIIRTLQGQRLELLKVQQSICVQWQSYHMEANRYNVQLNQIIKQNTPKQREYKALKNAIDEYKKQITEIYEKISKLSVKRKVLEKQMQSTNHQMNKCQMNIQQVSAATNQLKSFINDRKEKAVKLIEFIKTIDVISKEYCKSVQIMQDKVVLFEPKYEAWNSGEVVTWFENIDKGLLNKSESFLKFKTELISNCVSGKDLINLNDFSLKMMGLKEDKEREIVVNHLNKLLIHSQGRIDMEADHEFKQDPNDEDNKDDEIKNKKDIKIDIDNDNDDDDIKINDGNEM